VADVSPRLSPVGWDVKQGGGRGVEGGEGAGVVRVFEAGWAGLLRGPLCPYWNGVSRHPLRWPKPNGVLHLTTATCESTIY
jgi:hypothetical protein